MAHKQSTGVPAPPALTSLAYGEWKAVHAQLYVSDLGYVLAHNNQFGWRGPWQPQHSGADRTKFVCLGKVHFLAQLICTTFHGPKPSGTHTVDHINHDVHDDRAANLRWYTPTQQANHREWAKDRRGADENQEDLPGERWITVGRRRISNMGRFQSMNPASCVRWNPITTPKPCRGQKYATIKNESFHRLVALTWIGPPPDKSDTVDHINGDKTDNRVANLRWASRSLQNRNRKSIPGRFANVSLKVKVIYKGKWLHFASSSKAAAVLTKKTSVVFHPAGVASAARRRGSYHGYMMRIA